MSSKLPTPSSTLYSNNCGKRLYPGQLLNNLTKSLHLHKNARNNALAREFLNSSTGDMFSVVTNVIQSLAPKDPALSFSFYQTAFLETIKWIQNSPDESFVKLQRKVEVHNHFPSAASTSSNDDVFKPVVPPLSPATYSPSIPLSQAIEDFKRTKISTSTKDPQKLGSKTRKRTRFLDVDIRKATQSGFPCPYNKPSCSVCLGLWRRLRRCRKHGCESSHTDGAHVVLNMTELRYVKGKHAEYWEERAKTALAKESDPPASDLNNQPKRKLEWDSIDDDSDGCAKRPTLT